MSHADHVKAAQSPRIARKAQRRRDWERMRRVDRREVRARRAALRNPDFPEVDF